jgi:hypothetical protein
MYVYCSSDRNYRRLLRAAAAAMIIVDGVLYTHCAQLQKAQMYTVRKVYLMSSSS